MSDSSQLAKHLPEEFLFGVATAAYQIEGATQKDGRGPSIWDDFSHTKGKTINGDTGDVACDHYRLWKSDLDLIKSLGVDAYRFSFSWSRILPDGRDTVNSKGIAFYDQLIDGCLERDLDPFATLYHWDLPSQLQAKGGWTHRDTAYAFADYAALITKHYGDRLSSLTTFNEPWCSTILGYLAGIHAPGQKDMTMTLKAVHNQHLGHGLAVTAIKSARPELPTGIVLNLQSIYPHSSSDADKAAAVRHEAFHNKMFMDPLFKGHYPTSVVEALGRHFPDNWQDDMSTIHQPLDFWGLNYYTPARVMDSSAPDAPFPRTDQPDHDPSTPITDIGWEIAADTFEDLLIDINKQYDLPPCYITENGACFNDEPSNGVIADSRRIDYLSNHINAVAKACAAGAPIRGYFAWSLMDNFEWAEGYTMRFGLVHVDYHTQVRTTKQSGHWYSELIAAHHD